MRLLSQTLLREPETLNLYIGICHSIPGPEGLAFVVSMIGSVWGGWLVLGSARFQNHPLSNTHMSR